ncbi:MAG: hypothetical protein AVDCRST_MAG53-2250 [uncultured Solirubrobacteraceae bacterium]|uniref:Uncharacterized protein n=1 Tax=uncultured Solirubrobacteraceae bacterium TaxID=1162706 RepID=A0A6J4SFY3_9ACTN|nr:MAG: hypothetical protein AVDCRST_MAG53-2250 [uncultured Solirubrobacteraceae bacterium]
MLEATVRDPGEGPCTKLVTGPQAPRTKRRQRATTRSSPISSTRGCPKDRKTSWGSRSSSGCSNAPGGSCGAPCGGRAPSRATFRADRVRTPSGTAPRRRATRRRSTSRLRSGFLPAICA